MLKYLKTKTAGKAVTAALAAAFVMMSATTAYASGKTVADLHDIIYENTEVQLSEENEFSEPAPGTDVVTEDGMVEHYCKIEDLDLEGMEVLSFPDSGVATHVAGVFYNFVCDVPSNTRYKTPAYLITSGGRIAVSATLSPSGKKCWLGIMTDKIARYVEGTNALSHSFAIAETNSYRVFVQNNYTDSTEIHAEGSYIYEN